MTDLSPQALVVWNAYELVECDEFKIDPRQAGLAAALEAAADQVVPEDITWQSPREERRRWPSPEERAGEQGMACVTRRKLLAIAAELRDRDQRNKEDNQ